MKILIVENERLLADSLQDFLTAKGFKVEVVCDGETGKDYATLGTYDLLIMDAAVPEMNTLQVVRQVRANRAQTPIIVLTARSDAQERIDGLNAGADYYLTKPFDNRELMACINALLRRQGSQVDNLFFGNTELDLSTCMLRCGDKQVRLTAKEFEVMRRLLRNGEKLIPKETLLAQVWGYETDAVENHVEVYMAFLRKKLRSIGSNVEIAAIRRMGYHLELKAND